ncbi:YbjQ family protein [Gammaproteobacteria bacterium]|nr:YbjQ family protein [Gammaproteobacteria bacterium]MDC1415173.1 YbjQ family protein [Gammaproteobacteria bacterium]
MARKNCISCGDMFNDYGLGVSLCGSCRVKLPQEVDLVPDIQAIKITTGLTFSNHQIEDEINVITAECVFGMNLFRDMFAGVRDIFGGRSDATQKVLRDSRETCLYELKKEAYYLKADGVIGIDLDYSEFSGGGKSMLFLVASGTAVTFKK